MSGPPPLDDPSAPRERQSEVHDAADLTEATTSGCTFQDCDLSGALLASSRHTSTAFVRCTFARAGLFDTTLDGCKLTGSSFERVRSMRPLHVTGGDWSYVVLRGVDLRGVALRGVRLDGADLSDARLDDADLAGASMVGVELAGASLAGASVRGATMLAVHWTGRPDGTPPVDVRGLLMDVTHAVDIAEQLGARVVAED